MKTNLMIIFLAAILAACDAKQPAAVVSPATATQPASTSAAAPTGVMVGNIAETMNSGGYTYMLVRSASGEEWVAVRETSVKVGQTVTVAPQLSLDNFESDTLGRKFAKISFGTVVGESSGSVTATVPAGMSMPPNHPPLSGAKAPVGDVRVQKAPGGNTVSEVWAQQKQLADKPVVVRGKVVKFLGGIMGTNWMHVQDGSGSEEKGDHDLTVTTDDVAAVGDVVVVRGTLRYDKDFGSGYRYPVIVEKAKLTK